MPDAGAGIMVPLFAIVQKGSEIYTRSMAEVDCLVATSPDAEVASWVAWAMSQYHRVPHKIEPQASNDDIAPEIDDVKRRLAAAQVIEDRDIGTWVL